MQRRAGEQRMSVDRGNPDVTQAGSPASWQRRGEDWQSASGLFGLNRSALAGGGGRVGTTFTGHRALWGVLVLCREG